MHREPLEISVRVELRRRQRRVAAGGAIDQEWRNYRSSQAGKKESTTLQNMVGIRNRCMYCRDSRACDIEHYAPKEAYPEKTFSWNNHLWICTDCNRIKGTKFPLDAAGSPLVLNPVSDNFWEYFLFIPETGHVAPRWDTQSELPLERAQKTLEIIKSLNYESLTSARTRYSKFLLELANHYANQPDSRTRNNLLQHIALDELRISAWYLFHEGGQVKPWANFDFPREDIRRFRKASLKSN